MRTTLTPASWELLAEMATGAQLFAALRRSGDYMRDGCLFSESVKCRVWKNGKVVRHVRSRTVEPLYSAGLISHEPGESGDRTFNITAAGRARLANGQLTEQK